MLLYAVNAVSCVRSAFVYGEILERQLLVLSCGSAVPRHALQPGHHALPGPPVLVFSTFGDSGRVAEILLKAHNNQGLVRRFGVLAVQQQRGLLVQ